MNLWALKQFVSCDVTIAFRITYPGITNERIPFFAKLSIANELHTQRDTLPLVTNNICRFACGLLPKTLWMGK